MEVELDGDYFLINRLPMLRWKHRHRNSKAAWVGGGKVEKQQEARKERQLQRGKASYDSLWDQSHDTFA